MNGKLLDYPKKKQFSKSKMIDLAYFLHLLTIKSSKPQLEMHAYN